MKVDHFCENCGIRFTLPEDVPTTCPGCMRVLCEECWLGTSGVLTQFETCETCQQQKAKDEPTREQHQAHAESVSA